MGSRNYDFERLCRICACERSNGILIFSDEGKKHKLVAKIKKYLSIAVVNDDKLPHGVCYNCAKKIDSIHRFFRKAQEAQENLRVLLKEEKYPAAEADHSGSLLHSILTRGQNMKSSHEETNGNKETDDSQPEVTEMEVIVDPMLFLSTELNESELDEKSDSGNQMNHHLSDPGNKRGIKPYRCTLCPRGFNTEIGLQNHLWGHLPSPKREVARSRSNNANEKGCVYSSNGVLHTYSLPPPPVLQPTQNVSLSCPVCGKYISTKGNLKVHLETHRPKGKYDCDICGRVFKTQSNLGRHKEYHESIQFPCKECGRVYPTNSTLRAHSITHSDLRPHKCPLCDKTFKRNQDLKFHINQHTGARPYQCPYCPKAFASSGNCFSHRKRMHSDEVERDREMAEAVS